MIFTCNVGSNWRNNRMFLTPKGDMRHVDFIDEHIIKECAKQLKVKPEDLKFKEICFSIKIKVEKRVE